MVAIQTQKWDSATYLRTEEDMIAYLDAVQAEDDFVPWEEAKAELGLE